MKYLFSSVSTVLRPIKAKTRKGEQAWNHILITVTALQFTFPTPDWLVPVNIVMFQNYFWYARFGSLTVIFFAGCPVIIWQATETGSSSHDPLGRSLSEIGLKVALSILSTLTSFLGNFLIVYVDSRLKSWTNIFIQNLALTAIPTTSLRMPFWVISLYKGACIFSERWCEVQAVIEATLGITSILTMGLIAFNRFIRVVKQAMYNRLPEQENGTTLPWGRMDSFYVFCNTAIVRMGKIVYHPRYAICNFAWKIEHMSYVLVIVGGENNTTTAAIL